MKNPLYSAFKAARQPRLTLPAVDAIRTARQRLAVVAQRDTAKTEARAELRAYWESLGMAEPTRFSPEGERLAHMRNAARDAEELASRAARAVAAPSTPFRCPQSDSGYVYFGTPDSVFRNVVKAADVDGGPDHDGWFDNNDSDSLCDGSGLVWGVVAQLPGRNGAARYVAGYIFGSEWEAGATFDLSRIHESSDAARAANGMAKTAAEQERDYQEAWQNGSDWAEAGEELDSIRGQLRDILAERKRAAGAALPALCRAITERVGQLLAERAELRDKRAAFVDACPGWATGAARYRDAFSDGASLSAEERGIVFG